MRDMATVETFAQGVEASLEASGTAVTPRDAAAVHLARQYAGLLDQGADITKLGPSLLACLTQLGLTPRGRAAAVAATGAKGGQSANTDDGGVRSPLDELKARRRARTATAS